MRPSKNVIMKSIDNMVDHLVSLYGDKYRDMINESLNHYVKGYLEALEERPDIGPSLALYIHRMFEEIFKRAKDAPNSQWSKVTCSKGCSECCKMGVVISHEEAELIVAHCGHHNIPINQKTLKVQSRFEDLNWHQITNKYRSCIFLKDNLCQIYEVRPLACRNHFVVEDPSMCDLIKRAGEGIQHWRPIELQALASSLTLAGNSDYLAVKILEIFNKKN